MGAAGGPVAVRVGRVVDGAGQRLEVAAVDVLGRRQGHRLGGPPVVAAAEAKDHRPAGRDPGQLDRRLDRLRAAVREERTPAVAGQDVLEPLVEAQAGLVVDDVLLAVEQLRGLGGDGRRDPWMGVAGVGDADPRAVVEVAIAIGRDRARNPRRARPSMLVIRLQTDGTTLRSGRGVEVASMDSAGASDGGLDVGSADPITMPPSLSAGRTARAAARDQRLRRAETMVEMATNPTAVRNTIEPITFIWTGSALRWIE